MNKVFLAYLVMAVTIVGGHEEHMFAHALCTPISSYSRGSSMELYIFSPNLAYIVHDLENMMDLMDS